MKARYDVIGKSYNTTRRADPYLFSRLLQHLRPSKLGRYIDLGCGTGNYTKRFDQMGYAFVGVDPSVEMLEKARMGNNRVEWKQGRAETLDFPPRYFNGVTLFLTIHHWEDLQEGFRRIHHVTEVGGTLVLFTSLPRQMERYWLCHYFPKMMRDSWALMPTLDRITSLLTGSGFEITTTELYAVRPDLEDLFLYSGKFEPERYFDPVLRQGISSFSAVAHSQEIENGLQTLREDIDSGAVEDVMSRYANDDGDYLFLVAKKHK